MAYLMDFFFTENAMRITKSFVEDDARRETMKFLGEVAANCDPIAKRKADRVRGKTLVEVLRDYFLTRKNLKPATVNEYKCSIKNGFPDWVDRPVAEITKNMVEVRLRQPGKMCHARANNTRRVLRALCNHAMRKFEDENGRPILARNPVDIVCQNRAWYYVPARKRTNKLHELP